MTLNTEFLLICSQYLETFMCKRRRRHDRQPLLQTLMKWNRGECLKHDNLDKCIVIQRLRQPETSFWARSFLSLIDTITEKQITFGRSVYSHWARSIEMLLHLSVLIDLVVVSKSAYVKHFNGINLFLKDLAFNCKQ